jgi:hypothetical protein
MVLASCRLVASAVRHHNRLDAAAVKRIAVNTSADTARPMLTVRGLSAERGLEQSAGCRLGMAIILVPLSNWGMLTTALIEYTPEFRFTLLLPMPAWYIRADGGASNAVWLTSR